MEKVAPNSALSRLLDWCQAQAATDLHAQADLPYTIRVHGKLSWVPPELFPPPADREIHNLLRENFSPAVCLRIEVEREVDLSFYHGQQRYRANFSKQKGQQLFSFRIVPQHRLKLNDLQLPASLADGDKISQPITGMITKGTYVEQKNRLLQIIRWLEKHHYRRLTVFFCFLEGIHRPLTPTAFIIGLKNAKPGSWWEKIYAREVFKFDNAQNCLIAYQTLSRHGIDPGIHLNAEVNLLLISHNRAVKPDPEKLIVPPTSPLPLPPRNPRIRLFDTAEAVVPNEGEGKSSAGATPGQNPVSVLTAKASKAADQTALDQVATLEAGSKSGSGCVGH